MRIRRLQTLGILVVAVSMFKSKDKIYISSQDYGLSAATTISYAAPGPVDQSIQC